MPHTFDFDLLVIGDANPDVVLGPLDTPLSFGQHEQLVDSGLLTLGGSAAIMACGAARLGLKVAFAGRIGDDDAGRFVRTALDERGVDTTALRVDPTLATPLTVVLTRPDGDRAILTSPGTLTATGPEDVPESLLHAARHVHAASYFLLPQLAAALPELFGAARTRGATTSLDTNDDPSGGWAPDALPATLAVTDFLLPNAQEALALSAAAAVPSAVSSSALSPSAVSSRITSSHTASSSAAGTAPDSTEAAAAALAAHGTHVIVKNGADGAVAHDGSTVLRTDGIPARPVDTVGAGDSFDAGFVAAHLRGLSTADALALAAACGALSTRAHGGTPAQPTWDEAVAALSRNGKNL
ncbi:carbohydrate kinase family protein [Streptomyces sp. NPDC057621]|uniref:carbohydrate kinase family protein n=1 Tax=Streptomyces sp. NPDC057621 TaxID=3346186 RepID=UPI0036AC0848